MDPETDKQLDIEDEEYGGNHKMQYHQDGAIPALDDEEMNGDDDDEYDDLYNDVNVGDGFLQMQNSETQMPLCVEKFGSQQTSKNPESRAEAIVSQEVVNNAGVTNAVLFPEQKTSDLPAVGVHTQRESLPEIAHNSESGHLGYQGPVTTPRKAAPDNTGKIIGEPEPLLAYPPSIGISKDVQPTPPNTMNSNVNVNMNNRRMDDENGNTMLFVGELHWWTTDAELESVLFQYGKIKEIKFFDERASGKSKGYCQVEFYDPAAAFSCKESMNGHMFNGRACVVTFATPHTIKQMGASYVNKNQVQTQPQMQGRNPPQDGAGVRGNGSNYGGDGGRNFGRGGWGRGNQFNNRGPGTGPMRGRGGMGNRNYGQGLNGPSVGGPPGMMHPQGMMGPGFDLAFMGRGGGGYGGGFSGPAFPGMVPPFQGVNSMGLPGVAPHVNPAFFGRGMAPNGMGMMGNAAGMGGPHLGMWNDMNMGGWGGEEHGWESSYVGEDNASEYGYGEASHDKVARSSAVSREKERNPERDLSSNPDGEKYDRDGRYREEKDRYRDSRHKDRDSGYDDDRDRRQSSRSHSRLGGVPEDDRRRSRSRDADYGKRRRMPSE